MRDGLTIANHAINSLTIGVLAIRQDGRLLKMNHAAKSFCDEGDIKSIDSQLHFNNTQVESEFKHQLDLISKQPLDKLDQYTWKRSFPRADIAYTIQISLQAFPTKDWAASSTRFDRHIVMTIQSPQSMRLPTPELLRDFYDLTKAQARLVHALLDGRSTNQASDYLNISINTARSHLRSIYLALNVNTKAELLQLISNTLVHYYSETNSGPEAMESEYS